MIIFGTKASNIRNGQIINVDCPNCKSITTMKYSVFARYFHLYLIPIFPSKKLFVTECNSCQHTFGYVDVELIDSIKIKLRREKEKNEMRYPAWMYSGTFLILALIGFGFYDVHQTDLNNAVYIKNPKVGDVYYVKLDNGHYSSVRADKVTRTEVYVTYSDFEINSESDIYKVDIPEYYTVLKDTFDVIAMQRLYNEKTITEIIRNE